MRGLLVFVGNIFSLLIAIGGPQIFTTFAPPTDNVSVLRFVVFGVSAVAWVLAYLIARKWSGRETLYQINRRVIYAVIAAAAVLVAAGALYINTWETNVIRFGNGSVLVGSELTKKGKEYFEENEGVDPGTALASVGGKASILWTEASINRKRTELLICFNAIIFAAVFSLIVLYNMAGVRMGGDSIEQPNTTG